MTTLDPCSRIAGTSVRIGDLVLMGHTMLNLAVAAEVMRHATPTGTLDYAEPLPLLPMQVVTDFTAWAGARAEHSVERDRLQAFLYQSGWRSYVLGFDAPPPLTRAEVERVKAERVSA